MTPEHKIAYHHLGDMLRRVDRQGSRYQVVCDDGAIDHSPTAATGSTVAEAAADCAAQLRAAGWVPTHPRLEWRTLPALAATAEHGGGPGCADLYLLIGHLDPIILAVAVDGEDGWRWDVKNSDPCKSHSVQSIQRVVAEWCATNLPGYHLPPFPGTPDAACLAAYLRACGLDAK